MKKKGNASRCDCGGKLVYEYAFGRAFVHCLKCTPVQTVKLSKKLTGEKRGS